jgi:hypothetical protein
MSIHTLRVSSLLALPLGMSLALVQGCDDSNPIGNLAEECGLVCPVEGIVQGNASISGVASIDAFFSAVVGFNKAALEVQAGVDAELRGLALSLSLDPGASAAEIRGAITAKLEGAIDGGLKIEYAAPKCTVDAKVAIDATAKCDAEVDPGMVSVECKGSCKVDASAGASCDAEATVMCKGTAPQLDCSGSCTGTCELDASLACNGTCNGECDGTCTVTGANGQCAGECMGECKGTCELKAGAECAGKCQGSCEYQAPMGGCAADAEVSCQAQADASAECNGSCDGEVVPPKAKAECEASVDAEAKLRAECTPPSLEIRWQWSAKFMGDAKAQAEFKAWIEGFRARYSGLLAASARGELVLKAGEGLVTAATNLVGGLEAEIEASSSLKAKVGIACAVTELGSVGTVIGEGTTALTGSVSAIGEITAAVGG